MNGRLFRGTIFVAVAVSHFSAFLQYGGIASQMNLPGGWRAQVFVLLATSLAMSAAIPFLTRRGVIFILLALRGVILLICGAPLGENLMLEFTLITALVIEALAYLSIGTGLVFCGVSLVVAVLFQRSVTVASTPLPAPKNFDLFSFALYVGFVVIVSLAARIFHDQYYASRLVQDRLDQAVLQLAETNIGLQNYTAVASQQAAESERKRLARDVHDSIGYTLTNLIMMLEAAGDLSPQGSTGLRSHLQRARDQAQAGLLEVRKTVRALREVTDPQLTGLKAIHRLVTSLDHASHLEIQLELGDAPWSFGAHKDPVVYRFVQEGITNALRHGSASRISIGFQRVHTGVMISIADNGVGFAELREGFGLMGMRERIGQIGGRVEVASRPKEGTRLSAWIPLADSEE